MNTFKIIYIVIATCCAFVFSSCSIDDIEPVNQVVEENIIQDEASARQLLNGSYTAWDDDALTILINHMGVATEWYDYLDSPNDISGEQFAANTISIDNAMVKEAYELLYNKINNSNYVIARLEAGDGPDMSETTRKEIIAQARALRAIFHFDLLRMYGQFYDINSEYGIVVRTGPYRDGQELYARNAVADAYTFIIQDLEFAMENAPAKEEAYYISNTTAKAFLAKVYLYQGDFTRAATLSSQVISTEDHGYRLLDSYRDIFWERFNDEGLFSPHIRSDDADGIVNNKDIRPNDTFRALADKQIGAPDDGSSDYTSGWDPRWEVAYIDWDAYDHDNGKYPYNDSEDLNQILVLRMGEMYLIYAEAEARRAGGDLNDALAKLNIIRKRAGDTMAEKTLTDKATLLQDIYEEKILELFLEQTEAWFDLVRFHVNGDLDAMQLKPSITSTDQFTCPIPASAIRANDKLIQNPGYPTN